MSNAGYHDFFPGPSEMARRMRDFDWSKSDLGAPQQWPETLRVAVRICLTSRFPIVLWWGPQRTTLYNDGYIPVLGQTKHPVWLGRSGRECWIEIWDTIGPMIDSVFATGEATWSEDLMLAIDRHVPREEGYFTFSYSPIHDAGAVRGIFCAVNETTQRVLDERRLQTLRNLGAGGIGAKNDVEACRVAAATLSRNPGDIPFALVYLVDDETGEARLAASHGIPAGHRAAPHVISLRDPDAIWPL